MIEKQLTYTFEEKLIIKWDGTRFALVSENNFGETKTIILNPREMLDLVKFASNLGGGE